MWIFLGGIIQEASCKLCLSLSDQRINRVRHSEESKPWDFKAAKANLHWKIDLRIFDAFE